MKDNGENIERLRVYNEQNIDKIKRNRLDNKIAKIVQENAAKEIITQ